MVVTYLAIILPILLLGLYLYNWSYRNASQDLSRATLSQLTYYLEDLNREVEWMEIQQYDLAQDTELNKIAVTWNYMDDVQKAGEPELHHAAAHLPEEQQRLHRRCVRSYPYH
ncbi:hypothetical protein ACFSQ7_32305 [Paenibacillus rhizoplanae]